MLTSGLGIGGGALLLRGLGPRQVSAIAAAGRVVSHRRRRPIVYARPTPAVIIHARGQAVCPSARALGRGHYAIVIALARAHVSARAMSLGSGALRVRARGGIDIENSSAARAGIDARDFIIALLSAA